MKRKPTVDFEIFQRLDIRAGRVMHAEPFERARKPSFRLRIDFGEGVGELGSSAQLARHYDPDRLIGTMVMAVVNFEPRNIAGFMSECLVLGAVDPADPGDVVLVRPDFDTVTGWPLG
jgi:tRNA-binding protein